MSMTNPVKNLNDAYGTHGHTIVGAYNEFFKSSGVTSQNLVDALGESRYPRNIAEAHQLMNYMSNANNTEESEEPVDSDGI